jgi:hypothetical protein
MLPSRGDSTCPPRFPAGTRPAPPRGDPYSNGYSGNFTPNPGDEIYVENWYCDAAGLINVNGGYGCSYLADLTTGATLNCTAPNGSPCWSVPAIAGMTFGPAADFITAQVPTPTTVFQWAATGAGAEPPGPGECAWADRTGRGSGVHPGDTGIIFGYLNQVASLPAGQYAEIDVYNDSGFGNDLNVTQIVGFVSPPFSPNP